MRIALCGSLSFGNEMKAAAQQLEKLGHTVDIPHGVEIGLSFGNDVHESEKVDAKIQNDAIRKHYKKIKEADAILVVNPPKKGIAGYVGGNTFLEIGFAYVLNKRIYCLYPIPDMPYSSELLAMQPILLNENIEEIGKSSE